MNEKQNELVWPDNIVADRHEVTGKWVLWYLTDEQAEICKDALTPQPVDHNEVVSTISNTLETWRHDLSFSNGFISDQIIEALQDAGYQITKTNKENNNA